MRSLIATVFSVATLLSVSSSAFAQGAQPTPELNPQPTPQPAPQPTPGPTPSTASSSQPTTPADYMRAWPEPGRYHPCPSSVGFGNGRGVCLGLDEPRRPVRHVHVARSADGYGYRHHYGYHYGYAVPVFEKNGNAYYGFPAPSYIHTPWPIYAAVPIRPAPIVSAPPYGYGPGYWGGYGYGWR
jgi:hypothetical protein